jgi:PEP-CTERM motif
MLGCRVRLYRWIEASYIPAAGTYTLQFGVTNWGDGQFQSGLAIAGATIGDVPIGGAVPEPASLTLLGLGLASMGVRRWRQRKA